MFTKTPLHLTFCPSTMAHGWMITDVQEWVMRCTLHSSGVLVAAERRLNAESS
jgi:hypothetical protein